MLLLASFGQIWVNHSHLIWCTWFQCYKKILSQHIPYQQPHPIQCNMRLSQSSFVSPSITETSFEVFVATWLISLKYTCCHTSSQAALQQLLPRRTYSWWEITVETERDEYDKRAHRAPGHCEKDALGNRLPIWSKSRKIYWGYILFILVNIDSSILHIM